MTTTIIARTMALTALVSIASDRFSDVTRRQALLRQAFDFLKPFDFGPRRPGQSCLWLPSHGVFFPLTYSKVIIAGHESQRTGFMQALLVHFDSDFPRPQPVAPPGLLL